MKTQIRKIVPALAVCAVSSLAVAGCSGLGVFGSNVSCDELSSSEWKSLASGDRTDEADAIKECGTLDGMSRPEVTAWMGQPSTIGNQDSWTTADGVSDVPTITVQYKDSLTVPFVDKVFVNGD